MDVSRRVVGVVLLLTGLALMGLYYLLLTTYVGPIGELIGVGFCFMFLGLLTSVGEVLHLYPEEGF